MTIKSKAQSPTKNKNKECICYNCRKTFTPKLTKNKLGKYNCDQCRVVIESIMNKSKPVFADEEDEPWVLKQKLAGPTKLLSLKDVFPKKKIEEDSQQTCPETEFFKMCMGQIKKSVESSRNKYFVSNTFYTKCCGQCRKGCEQPKRKMVLVQSEEEKTEEEKTEEEKIEQENINEEEPVNQKPVKPKCKCSGAKCIPALEFNTEKCMGKTKRSSIEPKFTKPKTETKPQRSKCPEPQLTIRTVNCDQKKNVGVGCKDAMKGDLCAKQVEEKEPILWNFDTRRKAQSCIETGKNKTRKTFNGRLKRKKGSGKGCKCCGNNNVPKTMKGCLGHSITTKSIS